MDVCTKLVCVAVFLILPAQQKAGSSGESELKKTKDHIISLEKGALESFNNGDPSGYLKIYAKEITYFDESTTSRLDGYSTLKQLYDPIVGKIHNARFEMIKPKVQLYGEAGVLTFNLITYSKQGKSTSHWNSTEVYTKIDGAWKIIHSHWSFTKQKKKEKKND